MITVIENKDSIEGVFKNKKEAEKYLLAHPQKETCVLKDTRLNNLPLYIVECNFGEFNYCLTEEELINFVKEIDLNKTDNNEDLKMKIHAIFKHFNRINLLNKGGYTIHFIYEHDINEIKNGNIDRLKDVFIYRKRTRCEIDIIHSDSILLAKALDLDEI